MVDKDYSYLAKLRDYYARYRTLPSYSAIAELIGLSKRGAVKFVNRMIKVGYLAKAPDGRVTPANMFFARPSVGSAPAGFASPAYELLGDAITIDEYLVEHPSSTVLVEVNGDSMVGAGINDGDMLVVERDPHPETGKIVVAMVDGEFAIKYLQRDKSGYYLQSANPNFSNIRPQGSLEIYGVVVGQFRKI